MTTRWNSIRCLGANLVALCAGLIFSLASLEIGVRIFIKEPVLPRYVIDSGYGVRANQANVQAHHYSPGNYDITVSTNSAGMRGTREYSLEKPKGVHRILLLGDSMGFGFGVEDSEVVSAVLEDMLNEVAKPGLTYEVPNLSVSGFGQAELLITYRELGRKYNPDTVILMYYSNDVGNNSVSQLFRLTDSKRLERTGNSYLPGVRTREILYAITPIRWLFEHSQAWNVVRNRLSSIVQKQLLHGRGLSMFDTEDPEALALTRALLQQFLIEVQADGAKPIIAILPRRSDLTSNIPITANETESLGARVVDGREYLTREDFFATDSHIRPSAHRETAKHLKELIAASQ